MCFLCYGPKNTLKCLLNKLKQASTGFCPQKGAGWIIMQYLALTTFAGVITMNGHLVAGKQRHRLLVGRRELWVLKADRH